MVSMLGINRHKNVNANIGDDDKKLKFSEKVAVVISTAIGSFHSQVIQMFLLFFYTDMMKISAGYVAVLFLVTRIVDAFLSPVVGIIVDRMSTPWGKYKPWVVVSGVMVGISGWFTFTSFDMSTSGKLIYATVTYVIYSSIKAIGYGPNLAIIPAVTNKISDRVSINQINYILMMVAILIAQLGVQPLYKALGGDEEAKGFSIIMGAVAILSILVGIFQGFTIKEKYVAKVEKNKKGPSLKQMLVAVFTNKTALIVYIYVLYRLNSYY